MLEKKRRNFVVETGKALFVPASDTLEQLRRITRAGLIAGDERVRFRVKAQAGFYFSEAVERLLWDEGELMRTLEEHGNAHTGMTGDAVNCLAVWQPGHNAGFLVHEWPEGLRFAFLPFMTEEAALRERDVARRMSELADCASGIKICANGGYAALDELLRVLAAQLGI